MKITNDYPPLLSPRKAELRAGRRQGRGGKGVIF